MIKFAKAIFGNTDFLTAQAFVYQRDEFLGTPSNQVLLLCLITASGEDVFTKVRQTGLDLEEVFYDSEKTIPERLNESLDFIKDKLESTSESLEAQVVFWQENVLYIQSLKNQNAFILREGSLVNLSSDDGKQTSGHIRAGDRLLLLSTRFSDPIPQQAQTAPSGWGKDFIEKLIYSDIDNLDEQVDSLWENSHKIEPVAVVLVDNHIQKDFEEAEKPIGEGPDYIKPIINIGQPARHIQHNENIAPVIKKVKIYSKIFLAVITKKVLFFIPFMLSSKRRFLIFLVVLIVMVLIGAYFLSYQSQQITKIKQIETLLSESKAKYEKSLSMSETSPEEAKKLLSEAKNSLQKASEINPNLEKTQKLQQEIDLGSKKILKITEIKDFPVYLSLDLIKKDFSAKKISYSLGDVLLLDKDNKTLVLLDLKKKTNQILAGENQLGNAKFASVNGENIFVFSQDKGVLKVDSQTQKVTEVVKPDADWGNIADIFAFSSNLYLVDSLKNQIYKYVGLKNNLSEKMGYLNDGVQPDFSNTKAMFIDFSVWVLKSGPEFLKFTAGGQDPFSIGGLDEPIKEDVPAFFVSEQQDNVYILDKENSRLVVTKKNGQYQNQYKGEKFKTADDLIVLEEEKKLYLLEGNKIYQVGI